TAVCQLAAWWGGLAAIQSICRPKIAMKFIVWSLELVALVGIGWALTNPARNNMEKVEDETYAAHRRDGDASDAPLPKTCSEFWCMVVQEKSKSILMLCNFTEQNTKKCAVYFPMQVGQRITFDGDVQVLCKKQEQ
ncbi:hypothetical protein OSTOST_09586, partial [Ostertagia ostertagi]